MFVVVEGAGHTVIDEQRYDWKKGDLLQLPIKPDGVVFQHFNASDSAAALLLAAEPNLVAATGSTAPAASSIWRRRRSVSGAPRVEPWGGILSKSPRPGRGSNRRAGVVSKTFTWRDLTLRMAGRPLKKLSKKFVLCHRNLASYPHSVTRPPRITLTLSCLTERLEQLF